MEKRKEEEIKHYDDSAKNYLQERDFEGFNPFLLSSLNFLKETFINRYKNKEVLDFGCGNGIHSTWLKDYSKKVVGIDLSSKSLQVAKKRVKEVEFLEMDCEKLDFENNSFDVVFDGGTFSSLDFDKAIGEILRVLKVDGALIGIETLGHNPITNLKRKFNKFSGKRTAWAQAHIFKMKDFKETEKYFEKSESYFFHIFSWVAFPFLNFGIGRFILKIFQKIDNILILIFPFLKKYSFKIVFVFESPKK